MPSLHRGELTRRRTSDEHPRKTRRGDPPGRETLGVATVLLVEDEPEIVGLLRDFLAVEGFGVVAAADWDGALDALHRHDIVCVLLDVMLPGGSGFDVCRRIRERSDVPLLFLSARGEDEDKLRGLALGADDYIVKSATPAEVVARVKAVLRRAVPREPRRMRSYGRLEIDLTAHEVRTGGAPVALTAREFELLALFAEHPRQVLTREQVFERVWGSWGDRSAVAVYVRRLREKLELDPRRPALLVTVWGVGYRFDPA
jgi:DNA-binding response OmpR family regulator